MRDTEWEVTRDLVLAVLSRTPRPENFEAALMEAGVTFRELYKVVRRAPDGYVEGTERGTAGAAGRGASEASETVSAAQGIYGTFIEAEAPEAQGERKRSVWRRSHNGRSELEETG